MNQIHKGLSLAFMLSAQFFIYNIRNSKNTCGVIMRPIEAIYVRHLTGGVAKCSSLCWGNKNKFNLIIIAGK